MATTKKQTDPVTTHSADASGQAPPRRRRKPLRREFCDGIEAAVQAEPAAFQATRPRTMLGLMVRELVSAAARGRSDAVKTVMGFLDEAEARRATADSEGAPSQGNSAAQMPEPRWEWNENGEWDSSEREVADTAPRPPAAYTYPEPGQGSEDSPFERLYARFLRTHDAERGEEDRVARLDAEREGQSPPPAEAANSGNISAPQVRIAGRSVQT